MEKSYCKLPPFLIKSAFRLVSAVNRYLCFMLPGVLDKGVMNVPTSVDQYKVNTEENILNNFTFWLASFFFRSSI